MLLHLFIGVLTLLYGYYLFEFYFPSRKIKRKRRLKGIDHSHHSHTSIDTPTSTSSTVSNSISSLPITPPTKELFPLLNLSKELDSHPDPPANLRNYSFKRQLSTPNLSRASSFSNLQGSLPSTATISSYSHVTSNIIAHRGSRNEGVPENSYAAFLHALECGTDVIELDVWMTTDHEVVVHHDESLLRMTGVDAKIHSKAYKDLPPLLNNIEKQCERIKEYPIEYTSKIPLLTEILTLLLQYPYAHINIEFKQNSWELIQRVYDIIYCYKIEKRCYWFSLDEKINYKLSLIDKKIPRITSIATMLKILGLYYAGLLPFVTINEAVFGITLEEITITRVRNEPVLKNVPDFIKRLLAYLFKGRPPKAMVAPALFKHLRKRGIEVWFLGVNSEEDFNLALEVGATGILTDRIQWATDYYNEKLKQNIKFCDIYD